MADVTVTTYGRGGFDPDAPDGNIAEQRQVEVSDGPPSAADRIAALESRLDAVAALAEKASATATEVAAAAKPASPGAR